MPAKKPSAKATKAKKTVSAKPAAKAAAKPAKPAAKPAAKAAPKAKVAHLPPRPSASRLRHAPSPPP
jgi:hypothetical protein